LRMQKFDKKMQKRRIIDILTAVELLHPKILRWLSVFLVFLFVITGKSLYADENYPLEGSKSESVDVRGLILKHVLDKHEWPIAEIGGKHISIPLPVIIYHERTWHFFLSSRFAHGYESYRGFRIAGDGPKKGRIIRVLDDGITPDPNASFVLDLSITRNVLAIFISAAILCFTFITIAKKYKSCGKQRVPGGISGIIEPMILFVRDDIARQAIPEGKADKFIPYLLSLFFFIFFNNLLGLVPFFPGGANVTGNISVALVLALFTFFTLHIFASKDYWNHIFNTPGVPLWLKVPIPLMPIIELVGVIIKPLVLTLRLFANISAGHMIILGFVCLIFVLGAKSSALGYAISPLSVLFVVFMIFLKMLVAFIQAYVFTFFSALFFGMAVTEEHH